MDADRRLLIWNYVYKKIYTADIWEFWGMIDMDDIDSYGCAGFKKNIVDEPGEKRVLKFYNDYKDVFKISGDADFGLKKSRCEPLMHSICNFSLMPVNGGMNSKKGIKYKDKFDTFLGVLKRYWDCDDDKSKYDYVKKSIWKTGGKKALCCLKDYLDLFSGINDYCKKVYFLSEEEVDVILSGDFDYIKKAMFYFEYREKVLEKKMDKNIYKELISENIDDIEYSRAAEPPVRCGESHLSGLTGATFFNN